MCEVHTTNLQMMMVATMTMTSSNTMPTMAPLTTGPMFVTEDRVTGARVMETRVMVAGVMGVSGASSSVCV